MIDVRKGLLWTKSSSLVGTRLDQWPSCSWFSFNGPVYFGTKSSSPLGEKATTKQLWPTFSQRSCKLNERIITQNVNKELRLRGHLIQATTSKLQDFDLTEIRMKGKRVGFAYFDFEDDARRNLDVFLLSLRESKEEMSKASSVEGDSCALEALILLQKSNGSFQRVGTVSLKPVEKKKGLRWIFKNTLRTWVTLL